MNTLRHSHGIKNVKSANKFIIKYSHDRQAWKEILENELIENPKLLILYPELARFFESEERKKILQNLLKSGPENWIPHLDSFTSIITHKEIQEKIIHFYKQTPWIIQIQRDKLKTFLPKNFFETKIDEDFQNSTLFSLFLLMYGHDDIGSFDENMKKFLQDSTHWKEKISANIFDSKEVGFLCGQAEKNFEQALWKDTGFCIVNDNFLAKYYHPSKKVTNPKVSYIPLDTYHSDNGYMIWEDYFYAPTEKQHEYVQNAIQNNEKHIIIPNLALKPIRPMNTLTSQKVKNILQDKWLLRVE